MNTLKENNTLAQSPSLSPANNDLDASATHDAATNIVNSKARPQLKKEELEKIAQQLKKKLSKASITAKQSLSPVNSKAIKSVSSSNGSGSSPLRSYMLKNILPPSGSPNRLNLLSSSPNQLYSPNGQSPTQMRTTAASLMSSSPIRANTDGHSNTNINDLNDSPTKGPDPLSPSKDEPTMILQEIATPSKNNSLKPSPPLSANSTGQLKNVQTTPTLPRRALATAGNSNILKTPTQPKAGNYNDDEGADLLMYLATSPSPAKSYFPNTPRLMGNTSNPNPESMAQFAHLTAPNTSLGPHKANTSDTSNSFIAPPPPLTPKRHATSNARTPQNKLTPSVNLFNNLGTNGPATSGLPSSGLALTPAGFNMNDYVNFFTPSPGSANLAGASAGRNFLKTPEFNTFLANNGGGSALAASHSQNGLGGNQRVDGKMINFDKVGLFKNSESRD